MNAEVFGGINGFQDGTMQHVVCFPDVLFSFSCHSQDFTCCWIEGHFLRSSTSSDRSFCNRIESSSDIIAKKSTVSSAKSRTVDLMFSGRSFT